MSWERSLLLTSAINLGELKIGAIGLDVTPDRFVDVEEVSRLDARVKSVDGLWIAGQDSLMCGQVPLSAYSFIDFIYSPGASQVSAFIHLSFITLNTIHRIV